MREILSLKLLWFDPYCIKIKKGRSKMTSLLFILVELRGIEPLTPRLPGEPEK
jgi:hypothetical protein